MDYEVVEASNGLEVLREYARSGAVALVLDHEMPGGDGRTIARMIRNESDVPIVFLSGHDREDCRSIVTELPNVHFLAKPIDAAKLGELLASLISEPVAQT